MTSRTSIIALCCTVIGAAAAVYFPLHSDYVADRQAQLQQAAQWQQFKDALWTRIGQDEGDIAFLKVQLPKDKQDELEAIWKVRHQMEAHERAELDSLKVAQPMFMQRWAAQQSADTPSISTLPAGKIQ